jgi:hypothetical protein
VTDEPLLALIRKHESGARGYNADYRNDDRWTLTNRTFDAVRALGRSQVVPQGEASSAIGAYQFLTKTLDSLKADLRLSGQETFDPIFQDYLAIVLMNRRGRGEYLRGKIGAEAFANELAREWASLPVIGGPNHGRSYYAGDGLNKALVTPSAVLAAIHQMQAASPVPPVDTSKIGNYILIGMAVLFFAFVIYMVFIR